MALVLLDLDGTLITRSMLSPNKNYDDWAALPRRAERLAARRATGDTIAIITNQGAVAFGIISEAQARAKIAAALAALGLPADTPVYVCFAHPHARLPSYRDAAELARRKPGPAMLLEAIRDHPEAAAAGVLMVGDSEEDALAASSAGVAFAWAEEYFG